MTSQILVDHDKWVGEVEGDGGVEVVCEVELADEHVSSPSNVEASPYSEFLYRQLQVVTKLLEELGKYIHDE